MFVLWCSKLQVQCFNVSSGADFKYLKKVWVFFSHLISFPGKSRNLQRSKQSLCCYGEKSKIDDTRAKIPEQKRSFDDICAVDVSIAL